MLWYESSKSGLLFRNLVLYNIKKKWKPVSKQSSSRALRMHRRTSVLLDLSVNIFHIFIGLFWKYESYLNQIPFRKRSNLYTLCFHIKRIATGNYMFYFPLCTRFILNLRVLHHEHNQSKLGVNITLSVHIIHLQYPLTVW